MDATSFNLDTQANSEDNKKCFDASFIISGHVGRQSLTQTAFIIK